VKSSRTVGVPIAFLALLSLAAPLTQATPDAGPKCVPTPAAEEANPEWRSESPEPERSEMPDGVVSPLTHGAKDSPDVPEPPAKIASLLPKQPAERSEAQSPWGDLRGLDFASTALMYRGVPYRWAGMSSRGMDCSGLIARVMLNHGLRVPHQSGQLFKLGTPVSQSELEAGDLLFFRTRRRGIGHVGMYLGDGKFIHASSSAGRVVITELSDKHYQSVYVGARRIR